MKKLLTFIVISIGFVLLTALTFHSRDAKGVKESSIGIPVPGIPDSLLKIFRKSCMDCHAIDASGLAKGKLNFDKWESYSPEKQASKANDICEEVTKASMPPKGFRKNNPDLIPTEGDVKLICSWAQTLQK